jgi:diguanylate cyclase (GGDEF)-like protein
VTRFKATVAALLASTALSVPAVAHAAGAPPQGQFEATIGAAKAAMMSNPDVALTKARAAGELAKSMQGEPAAMAAATSQWLEGEALARLNHPEKAKPVLEAALATVERHAPGSKLDGDLLKSSATTAAATGDPQGALIKLHRAYEIYRRLGEARAQAIALQNIGSIYSDARDYARVLRYYEQANEVFAADPALTLSAHNNRGNAFKEMGEFAKAEREYRQALDVAEQMDSPLLEVRVMTNIASAQYLQGKLAQADATAAAGLERASGAAADWRPFLWGVRGQVAYARGDAAGAARFLERTFGGVDLAKSSMFYRDFHATARYVYERLGRDKEALDHLAAFKRLDDEGRDVAASVNSALMSARFDAANQELRIAKLKAEQAERAAKLTQSEQRLRLISWIAGIGATAALLVIGAVLFALEAQRRSRREVSAANARLSHAARHDNLTGLPNRAYFRELLQDGLDRHDGRCALLLIDLDRFKVVNDTMGHKAGDELLVQVARRLEAAMRPMATPARLGGDEFAVVYPDPKESLEGLADRLVAELSEPYQLDNEIIVTIGATVSIAAGPGDGVSIDALTQNADLALYRAKEAGRGRHARFAPWMREEADERRQLEADLRDALANDQLTLAYQPIVDAKHGKTVAYEALLRWDHPTRGSIPPSVFVPIAEETRLINELGSWVLRTACQRATTWPEHVKVAVNVSTLQVEAESLTATVVNTLAATGLAPHRLELEMTESVFLRQGARSETTLEMLRSLGVQLALDDFGTGYSSLSYLPRASFSKVKIDRSFVQAATAGCQVSIAVIRSIIALAQGLDMEITAEGVESKREIQLMKKLGCTQLQGFLIGAPAVSDEGGKAPAAARAQPEPVPAVSGERRRNRPRAA